MGYLIHVLKDGRFEIIDEDFIDLYDLDKDKLVLINDEDYKNHMSKVNYLTTFENGKFVYRDEIINETLIKQTNQAQIWEKIKQKRYTVTRGGVYVKSVDKWFHTDDSSRTQYLALQILPSLPPDLAWKTMDNSFVKMDKVLLTELAITILQNEQVDFANAERHRVAMLQAEKPLDYDYSEGWTQTYEEQALQGKDDE